ncbi:hypothetical protein HDU92_007239 [Lobulomyces angularis]|nr:hypothetical protein HDU92_007239 [Lobulomyces angularis]
MEEILNQGWSICEFKCESKDEYTYRVSLKHPKTDETKVFPNISKEKLDKLTNEYGLNTEIKEKSNATNKVEDEYSDLEEEFYDLPNEDEEELEETENDFVEIQEDFEHIVEQDDLPTLPNKDQPQTHNLRPRNFIESVERGGKITEYIKHSTGDNYIVKVDFENGIDHTYSNISPETLKKFVKDFKFQGTAKEE